MKHLTKNELIAHQLISREVQKRVREELETVTMDERVVRAIRATHRADITLMLIVLIDAYEASGEFCTELLDKWKELLMQYNDGKVELKQMTNHIRLATGIDVEEFCEGCMDFAEIRYDKF